MREKHSPLKTRLAIVSTYAPRRCGIATYSHDLAAALAEAAPDLEVEVCALDRDGFDYPPEVSTVISQDSYTSYRRAAARLADSGVDVVVIEHEYGIFGGNDGAWITGFATELTRRGVPYLVTLHTVLSEPTWTQAGTLHRLCRDAAAVTVFTETARTLAVRTGIAPPDRIVYMPHGAPPPRSEHEALRDAGPDARQTLASLADRRMLSTFGLLSPGKGLETAIEALGLIAEEFPDVSYLIAGATHPEIVRLSGEDYRESLVQAAEKAGVADRVVFLDSFLTDAEIAAILAQTEIFCTPYRSREQISSGALTFAVAAGRPVVSTAYHYAEDMLGDGAGITVPPADPRAFAAALRELLGDDKQLKTAAQAARERGSDLHWNAVGQRFATTVRACAAQGRRHQPSGAVQPPRLKLTQLNRLTDDGGIVQFSRGTRPDPASGYCVDDVARLAIVAAGLCGEAPQALREATPQAWLDMCLEFMQESYDPISRTARNMRGVDGEWLDEPHPGDHVGRLLWSLGEVAATATVPDKIREQAAEQLHDTRAAVSELGDLRSTAYALLGLVQIPEPTPELEQCLERLDTAWQNSATATWPWFEDVLSYDNARLAQALLAGGARAGDQAIVSRGLIALDWYLGQVGLGSGADTEQGSWLALVGNKWRRKGARRAAYEGDEQAIDAAAVVEACAKAWRITGDPQYADRARRSFAWFLGDNRLGLPLYDAVSGGCRDGLRAVDTNPNQGAESTLAYYQARQALLKAGLAD